MEYIAILKLVFFLVYADDVNNFTNRFRMLQDGEFQIGNINCRSAWAHISKNSIIPKPQLKLAEGGDDFARLEVTNSTSSRFWHLAGYVGNTINPRSI